VAGRFVGAVGAAADQREHRRKGAYLGGKSLHRRPDHHGRADARRSGQTRNEPDWSGQSRGSGFTLISKDGSHFLGTFLNEKQISGSKLGRFTVEPSFIEAVNRHVSRIDGRTIDVLAKNALTERQLEGEREFRKLLATATTFHFPAKLRGKPLILPVTDPKQVAKLVGALDDVELPLKQRKLAKDDFFIEITTEGNRKVRLSC